MVRSVRIGSLLIMLFISCLNRKDLSKTSTCLPRNNSESDVKTE